MNKHKGSAVVPEITYDEWLLALNEAKARKIEDVPEGFLDLKQLAKIFRSSARPLSEAQTRKLANELDAAKLAERKKFNGAYHYRLLK